jgi:hypothetical protein
MHCGSASAAVRDSLTAALEAARADAAISFHLRVDCTDQGTKRSLEVIRGTVAVWSNELQLTLAAEDRSALIDLLLDHDFASFAPRYGENPKAEKQEAPLRVSCRIHLALQGVEKSSVQILDWEQSELLLGLARGVLNRIEPLAARGVAAAGLEDGLTKIADGVLAPEVLSLRLLTLPGAGGGQSGSILRIEGGQISRQAYVPGKTVGQIRTQDLAACQLRDIVSALRGAQFWALPINLHADAVAELEVSVLSQRKIVIARTGFKVAPEEKQAAFAGLLSRLMDQPSACIE